MSTSHPQDPHSPTTDVSTGIPATPSSPVSTSSTLRYLDVAKMLREPPPKVPWLVDGIVARGCLTILHGIGGIGKSFLALQMCVAAANGRDFLNRPVRRCRVLYVDAENGEGEAHRRLHQLGAEAGLEDWIEYIVADGHDLIRHESDLKAAVHRCKPDLVVIDSLASIWSINEIDATEMTRALTVLTRIADRYKVGVLALHHDKKDGSVYRGSGAVRNVAQVVFHLVQHNTDDSSSLVLMRTKNRMGVQNLNISLQLSHEENGLQISVVSRHVSARHVSLEQEILVLLGDEVVRNSRAIATDLGHNETSGTVSRALKALRDRGELVQVDGGVTLAQGDPAPLLQPLGVGALERGSLPLSGQHEESVPDDMEQCSEASTGGCDVDWDDEGVGE